MFQSKKTQYNKYCSGKMAKQKGVFALYCIVLYLYLIVLYCIVLYCILLYCSGWMAKQKGGQVVTEF